MYVIKIQFVFFGYSKFSVRNVGYALDRMAVLTSVRISDESTIILWNTYCYNPRYKRDDSRRIKSK